MKIKSRIKLLLSVAQATTPATITPTTTATTNVPNLSQSSIIFSNCQNFWGANNFSQLYNIANILNKSITLISNNNINLERLFQGNISTQLATGGPENLNQLCKQFINNIIKLNDNNKKISNIQQFLNLFSTTKNSIGNNIVSGVDKDKIQSSLNTIITNIQAK